VASLAAAARGNGRGRNEPPGRRPPGEIPLRESDEVVGAIGVSGGTVEQDQEVEEAGAAAS